MLLLFLPLVLPAAQDSHDKAVGFLVGTRGNPAGGARLVLLSLGKTSLPGFQEVMQPNLKTGRTLVTAKETIAMSTDGRKLVLINRSTGLVRTISTPERGIFMWPIQSEPKGFIFQGFATTSSPDGESQNLWMYHENGASFTRLPAVTGVPRRGGLVLDDLSVVLAFEDGGRTVVRRLNPLGGSKTLYTSASQDELISVLGTIGTWIGLGSYVVDSTGKVAGSRLVLVDPEGARSLSTSNDSSGFRFARVGVLGTATYALASAGLTTEGSMTNRIYRFDLERLIVEPVVDFDFWYMENVEIVGDQFYLFNSELGAKVEGVSVDPNTRRVQRFRF